MNWRTAWDTIKQTAREFVDDKCPRLGAALAFYTAPSIAPLLLVVIGIAGLAFGEDAARGEIARQLSDLLGREQAELVESMVAKSASTKGGVIATVVGIVTL